MHWLFPFFYASEIWTLRKRIKKGLTSFEMKFFRTDGYTLFDHKRNKEILEDVQLEPFDEKLRR
jgi:hypothetical protein